MLRSMVIALGLTLAWTLSTVTPAVAVGPHLHCLHTPGGTHAIGAGVTANAPHDTAFHNFHGYVHLGAHVNNSTSSPVFVTVTGPTGSC